MPVHPSIKHQGDTLGNCFSAMYPGLTFRPVNRLDRDPSGLCMVAKSARSAALMQGNCKKVYYAAVEGETAEAGTIDAPIAHFQRIALNRNYSLERITLETGRTHQIRVHFSHIGHPLAGDELYGGGRGGISRQALHCGELTFTGGDGRTMTVTSPLPEDILNLFKEEDHEKDSKLSGGSH